MFESLRDHGRYLVRSFRCKADKTGSLRDFFKVRIMQVRSGAENACGLEFQLDKGEGIVLEDNDLYRQFVLSQREHIPHEHRETAIARHGDYLPAGIACLRPDGLRQCIRHRSMREGTEESTLAIHGEIARGPDRRSSYVACENRVVRRELIKHPGDILRMDRLLPGIACGKFVQSAAGLSIVL